MKVLGQIAVKENDIHYFPFHHGIDNPFADGASLKINAANGIVDLSEILKHGFMVGLELIET